MNQLKPVLIEDFNEIKSPSSLQYSPDEKTEETLQRFFQSAALQEIPDDGFSRKVMNRLSNKKCRRLSDLWTFFCIVVAALLGYHFQVISQFVDSVKIFVSTLSVSDISLERMLLLLVGCFSLLTYKMMQMLMAELND